MLNNGETVHPGLGVSEPGHGLGKRADPAALYSAALCLTMVKQSTLGLEILNLDMVWVREPILPPCVAILLLRILNLLCTLC